MRIAKLFIQIMKLQQNVHEAHIPPAFGRRQSSSHDTSSCCWVESGTSRAVLSISLPCSLFKLIYFLKIYNKITYGVPYGYIVISLRLEMQENIQELQ